jgi:hypothetical protein
MMRLAIKAGLNINGASVAADGSVSLTFGEPGVMTGNSNPWDQVLHVADKKRSA